MKHAIAAAIVLAIITAAPAIGAEPPFKDVPKDHWAAEYVAKAASDGIMKGYPDSTFKGDKAVTRYELAVALERMIEVVEKGLKPEVDRQKAESGESKATPSTQEEGVESPKSKVESQDAAARLKAGGYIAADSPLLTNQQKTVSPAELAQALASVADRLIQNAIPPPKE